MEKHVFVGIAALFILVIISHSIAYFIGMKAGVSKMVEFFKTAYPEKYFVSNKIMEYKGYKAFYSYDPRDNIFFGTVIDIKDKVTFQCAKEDQIEKEFHDAVDDYIQFCSEIGKEPENPQ